MLFFQMSKKNGLALEANPRKKRETGLEPATACLEGRNSLKQRLLVVNRPLRLIYTCQFSYELY